MGSPFPGMDPYLESHWGDVHASLVIYIRDALQGLLPVDLRARVDGHIEFPSERYVKIVVAGKHKRVITVVVVLTPDNKTPGQGMVDYLRKQHAICQSETNLVEIDLLRGGRHVLAVPLEQLPHGLQSPYHVFVRRGTKPRHLEGYPIPLAQKLPNVRIPLRPGDIDARLDLQPLIEQCY